MKKTIAMLALAGLLVLPGFAGAVHGSPYTANGIAIGPGNVILNARVHWTGFWSGASEPPASFVVTLTNMDGSLVSTETFPGSETWTGPVYYNTEFFQYWGWALGTGCGQTSCEHLWLHGFQFIQISTGQLWMGYVGNYHGYQLELIVN